MSNSKLHRSLWLQADLCLVSPMRLGNGLTLHSDDDLLLDSEGRSYIPGSSLAGVIYESLHGKTEMPEEDFKQLFGEHYLAGEKEYRQSMVIFHDAFFKEKESADIVIRDGIEMNGYTKTTKNQSKYNYEVLNPEVKFQFRMEILIRDEFKNLDVLQFVSNLLEMVRQGDFRIGAKTSRGLGQVTFDNILYRDLRIETAENMLEYAAFDWKQLMPIKEGALPPATYQSPYTTLEVPLQVQSTLLIRSYFLNNFDVDCEQLTVNDKAVIPGSAWAGVFRHKTKELLEELSDKKVAKQYIKALFGAEKEEEETKRSRIVFGESVDEALICVEGKKKSQLKEVTRNKIDRFTSGVLDTGLFSERIAVGGIYTLQIQIKQACNYEIGMILLTIAEIRNGLVALGGDTSIGRGTFMENGEVRLNGKKLEQTEMQQYWNKLGVELAKVGEA